MHWMRDLLEGFSWSLACDDDMIPYTYAGSFHFWIFFKGFWASFVFVMISTTLNTSFCISSTYS
jgi:hypothetical protein